MFPGLANYLPVCGSRKVAMVIISSIYIPQILIAVDLSLHPRDHSQLQA